MISRSDEAQQAIFNECERDALAKLDLVLGITENPDVADIMNVKVVDTAMLSRILEYGKSEEMVNATDGASLTDPCRVAKVVPLPEKKRAGFRTTS